MYWCLLFNKMRWFQSLILRSLGFSWYPYNKELGHISVDEATVVLDSLQDKHWELGGAQQSMLYLLKSLYQNQQQSPKA